MGPVGGAPGASAGARWRWRAHGTRPARGQSLVEFAMVAPIFLLLVFAVIEYSLINSAIGAYNFAAKDAARYGAIVGPTNASADTTMQKIINSHVLGVVAAQPVELDIYEASESGTYDPANPYQDKYSYTNGTWTVISQSWLPGALTCGTSGTSICRDDRLVSQDYLGVHIIYHYTYVTAFFSSLGATITLTADSVQRIEPQEIRHYPTPGTEPVIAALSPVVSGAAAAPSLGMMVDLGALGPLWAFLMARASEMWRASETRKEERQS